MTAVDELKVKDLGEADPLAREQCAELAVRSSSNPEEQHAVARAAFGAMSSEARDKFMDDLVPQNSIDRRWVYVSGFTIAFLLCVSLALIAWGAANTGNKAIANAIAVGVVSLPSAIIGGLLGAYVSH